MAIFQDGSAPFRKHGQTNINAGCNYVILDLNQYIQKFIMEYWLPGAEFNIYS